MADYTSRWYAWMTRFCALAGLKHLSAMKRLTRLSLSSGVARSVEQR
jgi:hypothetical protein